MEKQQDDAFFESPSASHPGPSRPTLNSMYQHGPVTAPVARMHRSSPVSIDLTGVTPSAQNSSPQNAPPSNDATSQASSSTYKDLDAYVGFQHGCKSCNRDHLPPMFRVKLRPSKPGCNNRCWSCYLGDYAKNDLQDALKKMDKNISSLEGGGFTVFPSDKTMLRQELERKAGVARRSSKSATSKLVRRERLSRPSRDNSQPDDDYINHVDTTDDSQVTARSRGEAPRRFQAVNGTQSSRMPASSQFAAVATSSERPQSRETHNPSSSTPATWTRIASASASPERIQPREVQSPPLSSPGSSSATVAPAARAPERPQPREMQHPAQSTPVGSSDGIVLAPRPAGTSPQASSPVAQNMQGPPEGFRPSAPVNTTYNRSDDNAVQQQGSPSGRIQETAPTPERLNHTPAQHRQTFVDTAARDQGTAARVNTHQNNAAMGGPATRQSSESLTPIAGTKRPLASLDEQYGNLTQEAVEGGEAGVRYLQGLKTLRACFEAAMQNKRDEYWKSVSETAQKSIKHLQELENEARKAQEKVLLAKANVKRLSELQPRWGGHNAV